MCAAPKRWLEYTTPVSPSVLKTAFNKYCYQTLILKHVGYIGLGFIVVANFVNDFILWSCRAEIHQALL